MILNPLLGVHDGDTTLSEVRRGELVRTWAWDPDAAPSLSPAPAWFTTQRGAVAIRLNASQATLDGIVGTQRLVQISTFTGAQNHRTITVSYSGSTKKPFLRIERTGAGGSGTSVTVPNAMTGGTKQTIIAEWDSEWARIEVMGQSNVATSSAIDLYPDGAESLVISGAFPVASPLYASPYQIAFFSSPLTQVTRNQIHAKSLWLIDVINLSTAPYIELRCVAVRDGGVGVVT